MPPKEDEVPLIVKGANLAASELRPLRKETGKEPCDSPPDMRVEIVQYELREVVRRVAVVVNVFVQSHTGHPEFYGGTCRQVHQNHLIRPLSRAAPHQHIRVLLVHRKRAYLLNGVVLSRVIETLREYVFQFSD